MSSEAIDEALHLLERHSCLSESDIAAIDKATDGKGPLFCIANERVIMVLDVLAAGAPYEPATGEES